MSAIVDWIVGKVLVVASFVSYVYNLVLEISKKIWNHTLLLATFLGTVVLSGIVSITQTIKWLISMAGEFGASADGIGSEIEGVAGVAQGSGVWELAASLVAFVNSFIPLDVMVTCAAYYMACACGYAVFKFIKSFVPTISS